MRSNVEEGCGPFYGKYRGTVINPIDVTGLGRVQVSVTDVLGDNRQAWAMPAAPWAGKGVGFFAIPPEGASVWVEFERGDPDYPIWSGCFWEKGQEPAGTGPLAALKTVLKTDLFNLLIDHNPAAPSFLLEMKVGGAAGTAKIEAAATGMTISCAGSTIAFGADGVSINNTNLKILK
jgi:hypothetical protein